jgi:hypothetical protein
LLPSLRILQLNCAFLHRGSRWCVVSVREQCVVFRFGNVWKQRMALSLSLMVWFGDFESLLGVEKG